MGLTPGAKLGSYEILLSIGGMGEVYKATDIRLGRLVAIKVLPAQFSNQREFILWKRELQSASFFCRTAATTTSTLLATGSESWPQHGLTRWLRMPRPQTPRRSQSLPIGLRRCK